MGTRWSGTFVRDGNSLALVGGQGSLGYTGAFPPGSPIAQLAEHLQNPYKLDEAQGSLADDMRIKLLYDLAYTASLEKLSTFLRTELGVIVRTPLVMLRMAQGR